MKHYLTSALLIVLLLWGCGPTKKISSLIGEGQYDEAIDLAVRKLQKTRNVSSTDKYVLLLEEAFAKAQQRDMEQLERWQKENREDKWEKIYDLLVQMNLRQEKIRPLLPLRVVKQNREARFDMRDFTDATIEARKHYVAYLYQKALKEMAKNTREAYRQAYSYLEKIDFLQPGYRDVERLMEEARRKGTVYVGIQIENRTGKILPRRLLEDLTQFDQFDARNFWVRYETFNGRASDYDYTGKLIFTDLQISPEREREKEFVQEKEIIDGYRYQTDKDGKKVKVPVYKKVRAQVHLYEQNKEAAARAKVEFYNPAGQLIFEQPLEAQYVFVHRFATYRGDKRALDQEIAEYVQNKRIPFPSDEQMAYDVGREIKNKFYELLGRLKFD